MNAIGTMAKVIQTHPRIPTIYFLKGNDVDNILSVKQAKKIETIIMENKPQVSSFVYNSTETLRKLQSWNRIFPWIKTYYAMKSNPTLPLLKDLQARDVGFDCASRVEMQTILNIGGSKDQIVYSNTVKDENDLVWAEKKGIKLTVADSIDELIKTKELAPKMSTLWRISITENESNKNLITVSNKFGDDIESEEEIHERMKEIKKMGVNLKGIHFHCGSGWYGATAFKKAVPLARKCMKIGREYGHEMSIMDVGGGFPAGDITQSIIEALKLTQNDPLGYKVIAEPGRHFCAKNFYLLARVIGKRVKKSKIGYHLNESLYHSFNSKVKDAVFFENSNDQFYRAIRNGVEVDISETKDSALFGMTSDGGDIITRNLKVPTSLKIGDWLCISGMGAYTYGSKSTFNGMNCTEKVFRMEAQFN